MNWHQLLSPRRFGDKPETNLSDETRSRFEQDYDRIIFSHPFRKLQDKTQVFPLPENDFVHTRLTHSLEVSSVGRSLGKAVGEQILKKHRELVKDGYSIHDFGGTVAAACLAHDLGNPPFGHSGETAISSFFRDAVATQSFREHLSDKEWADLIAFEGNAQGFRILNDPGNSGLRLTYATLGAFTKYPRSSAAPKDAKKRKSQKKFGFYQTEAEHFQMIATEMGLVPLGEETWCRHPLAFLVEAADDICYNIIDLEDGCRLGLVSFEETKELLKGIIREQFSEEKLQKIPGINEQLGMLRALSINTLIRECVDAFILNEEAILQGAFDIALTDCIPSAVALGKISSLSIDKIYRSRQVLEREAGGFEVIGKLMAAFCQAAFQKQFDPAAFSPKARSVYRLLPDVSRANIENSRSVYENLRIVCDYISSLTDSYAIKLYKIIFGFSLPAHKS